MISLHFLTSIEASIRVMKMLLKITNPELDEFLPKCYQFVGSEKSGF